MLHGKVRIIHYFHMLFSGHISEYMSKWYYLYWFFQQGWKNINSLIKNFFHRTNYSGYVGKDSKGSRKSKLKAIGK